MINLGSAMNANELIHLLKIKDNFSFNETFSIYKECARLLNEDEPAGQNLLIHILNYKEKFSLSCQDILTELIESIGFYPYLQKENLISKSTTSNIRMFTNKSDYLEDKIFHDDQKQILDLIYERKNLVISAPTSFGKSILIQEIVASEKFKNLLIIQPTLALLDETRRNLKSYRSIYNLITKTTQEPKDKNIFLFTAERTNEYLLFPSLDILIIDEFYKLSAKRDDGRSYSLNNAFLSILKNYPKCQFYLLGPNIEGISNGFEEKYQAKFIAINTKLVSSEIHNVFEEYPNQFGERGIKRQKKEEVLFELLSSELKNENTLVYCASPRKAHELSRKYTEYIKQRKGEILHITENETLIEWLNKYVSKSWSLSDSLKYGVAVHDGTMPKHLLSSILELFNNDSIKCIFCTSTIIEGVNTNAKNVIYFDGYKGKQNNKIDYFDYSNIRGRAGRLMKHYIGHIYNFVEPPKYKKLIIDIPFHEQNPIQDEVLINLKDDDIISKNTDQYHFINSLGSEQKTLFSKNGTPIKAQKNLFDYFSINYRNKYSLLNWVTYPTKEQKDFCLQLIWDFLTEKVDRHFFYNKFINFNIPLSKYLYSKDINSLIKDDVQYWKNRESYKDYTEGQLYDYFIQHNFKLLRLYIQFKIPKWLNVLNNIQKFFAHKENLLPGNYSQYIKLFENNFIQDNIFILEEYGVPNTALYKLSKFIPENLSSEQAINLIKEKKLYESENLLEYERQRLINSL